MVPTELPSVYHAYLAIHPPLSIFYPGSVAHGLPPCHVEDDSDAADDSEGLQQVRKAPSARLGALFKSNRDSLEPRQCTSRIATGIDKGVPPAIAARILRMEGAHLNGYENLPIWIAAVLAGNMAHLDNYTLNVASLLYIGGRIAYNYVYFNQVTEFQSWVRTGIFFGTLSLPMYLLFKAAANIAAT